ncbi:MAG: hypothetical protein HY225_03015 [Candidatus Vogelbacteria bacterium]|nr:hypothetical protein [Candidatus Vogelbacteria bacterium]
MWEAVTAAAAAIFVVGSWQFLVFVALVVLFALWGVQNKNGDWAAGVIVLAMLGFQLVGPADGFKPFTLIRQNPGTSAILLTLHLVIGFLIYSPFVRWLFFSTDRLNELYDLLTEFMKTHDVKGDEVPAELIEEWVSYTKRYGFDATDPRPKIADHKQDYLRWAFMWEVDAPWTLSRKPLKRFGNFCYRSMSGAMDRSSNWFWRNMIKNFPAFRAVAAATTANATVASAVETPKTK